MKKGEVKISTLVYTIIIAMATMMLFAKLTLDFTKAYGKTNLPEYNDYEAIFGELNSTVKEIAVSQADVNETLVGDQNYWERTFNSISKAVKDGYNILTDNLIVRAMKTITIPFKLMGSVSNSLRVSFENSKFEIPFYVQWIIYSLAAVSIIFAILRAFWGKQI